MLNITYNTQTIHTKMSDLKNAIFTYDNVLPAQQLDQLTKFVHKLDFDNHPSFVYHTVEKHDKIDETIRKSQTVYSHDPALMAFISQELLPRLVSLSKKNDKFDELTFELGRDYVIFIKYKPGGFFDWHVDHEKILLASPPTGFKEMHMIFCLEGASEGGTLSIQLSDSSVESVSERSEKSEKTEKTEKITAYSEVTAKNSCLLFDKQLKHRADTVKSGTKMIMTVDVFVSLQDYSDY